jgi:hypothetical protein
MVGLLAGLSSLALGELPGPAGAHGGSARLDALSHRAGTDLSGLPRPAGTGLHVIPFPGTPDASRRSPVIFSSLSRAELASVTVTGSHTGLHRGRIEALPARAGTAFVPGRPFAPDEEVRVVAELRSAAAGTASGDPGATRLSFSFGVAAPARVIAAHHAGAPAHAAVMRHRARARSAGGSATQSFHSNPGLNPPAVSASADPDRRSGDMFLTPGHFRGGGLMIRNPQGHLVWYDALAGKNAYNLAVQSYQGQRVLTWFQGPPAEDVIANSSYQTVAVVKAVGGYGANLHDFLITPQGTAWLEATAVVPADLSSVGGPSNGALVDYVIQEVDIQTGQLLWQWDSYGHIPLQSSHLPIPANGRPWDPFHLNSLQVLPDGNLLLSARHTWSVYKVSTKTGEILWTLGGRDSQFKMGLGSRFEWQHDVRLMGTRMTLFDDGAGPSTQNARQSSAKVLLVNGAAKTVTLIHRYTHTPPLLTGAMGSAQTLPNGHIFVGWGTAPDFSEYTPSGQQVFNGSFALGTNSYRAYRFPWAGHPVTPPDVAALAAPNGYTNIWASWNGATTVVAWRVLGGPTPLTLLPLATQSDDKFETQVTVHAQPAYVEVQALNAHGQVIPNGTSTAEPVG